MHCSLGGARIGGGMSAANLPIKSMGLKKHICRAGYRSYHPYMASSIHNALVLAW
ncbi:hypothetical protein GPAL_0431 [Glaciecola pallidula DSM 14239 = ACAM 615]|uniref:Uncharacterized protein n=1 Tax=Brumicola pallidula DSM 14239 = ACAM 615 TaxID=1121922 RepID=K6YTQ7_9ALTE|nr:hypothetical protein GPAL_0431 [Glaciecola pallidula DSM 14239 = ACAM 615]